MEKVSNFKLVNRTGPRHRTVLSTLNKETTQAATEAAGRYYCCLALSQWRVDSISLLRSLFCACLTPGSKHSMRVTPALLQTYRRTLTNKCIYFKGNSDRFADVSDRL